MSIKSFLINGVEHHCDYNELENIPEINGVLLKGKLTTEELGIKDGKEGPQGEPGAAGADGYSPTVAIKEITGGHRVTITDANGTHSFDVMDGEDGEGGGSSHRVYGGSNVQLISTTSAGTYIARLSDLDEGVTVGDFVIGEYIDNVYIYKVIAVANGWAEGYQSEAIKLTGPTKTSDLTNDSGFYVKPSGGIPKSDLASAVRASLGKADAALQSVPSTYRTAAAQDTIDLGKIDKNQGEANAGKFLGIGNDGIVVPAAAPSGGSEWELVVDFTTEEEVSSVSVSFDSTVRDKILAANEISFVSYFVSTTDSTITAKGTFTQRICSGDTWKVFLRPDNGSNNIVPASGQANNLYRIVHEQKCAPFGWFPGDDGTAPYLRHSGYTNSANPSISTSTSWGFDMSFAEYAQEIDNANFSTNTKFGVGTSFRIYVR